MSLRSWQSTLQDCVVRGAKSIDLLLHLAPLTQTGATSRFFIKVHGFLAFFLFCCVPVHANTINAVSCSLTDAQNAVNSANNGDTVVVPTGVCSWAGGTLTIPSTVGITLSGTTVTITGSSHITINANGTTTTRVTGFTLTGAWPCCGNSAIAAYGSPGQATYRIDHNTITGDPATNGQTLIQIQNNGPGLIDHNTLSAPNNAEVIHNFALGSNGNNGWVDDVTPGGSQMVFIEDNTITNTGTSFLCSAVQSYYGARTVIRHNTLNFCQVDQHGTAGNVGARWWEIYENTFQPGGSNQSNYAQIRAGSGVFFNNHVVGVNTGPGIAQFAEEDTAAPQCDTTNNICLYQIGRGIYPSNPPVNDGTSSPAYYWGNDSSINLQLNGMTSNTSVVLNRDFFSSATQPATLNRCESAADVTAGCPVSYSYTPFTYPHPLQNASLPQPPTALAVVVH